ncbi:MAG: serine protease [Pirellulaceae bacterium]|nr:serine protease [Pirellulaceae bacterium]
MTTPNRESLRCATIHALSLVAVAASVMIHSNVHAQSVCLPAPRLLTTMPMGGQAGTEFELTITGESIEAAGELVFSHPGIQAKVKESAGGKAEPNRYVVTIAKDCPPGIHEARVMTRLGLSSSRVFNVSTLPEVTHPSATPTLETALPLDVNSICNAVVPVRAVNFYSFAAKAGQRIVVDCAAQGIDSELNPVLVLGDAEGRDLRVQRRGGAIDFVIPKDGRYTIKVHDLTFQGGSNYFYRLSLQELPADAPLQRMPATRNVSSHSWPPADLPDLAAVKETEPNNDQSQAQKITLPCDISGSFFPAADIDRFEFTAKKGEVWWVEVASERLGHPTDPAAVIQHISGSGDDEQRTDVAELSDIPSPVKVSSYGYSYDGPPYNAGSVDILGKLEIKADGIHRLQLTDLLGSTRNDPNHAYRLIIRKAQPDFAIVMWGLHMQLRNGDRNALSKPIALRGGTTMPLEVVVIRRDGFAGEIELVLEDLPDGVTASGLTIGAGQSKGMMLVTADEGAPRGFSKAKFYGRAVIDGQTVVRNGHMASMAWPIRNARDQITSPRLLIDIPVSVGGEEVAPLTIAAREEKVWEANVGEKLTVPLIHMRRGEFSGATLSAKTMGFGFDKNAAFEIPLTADHSEAVLDLAKLKTKPGDYTIAFYGGAVAKHRHNPDAVIDAQAEQKVIQQEVADLAAEVKRLAGEVKSASATAKAELEKKFQVATAEKKSADAALAAATKKLAAATKLAQQKDIADIMVSQPIAIRVLPGETK